jgi:glycosyltransferase involved in cell wall biosynthesis
MASVSLLTITQFKRQASLLLLRDLILDQDYPHLLEWILVEGSPTSEEAKLNDAFCKALGAEGLPIRYIPGSGGDPIGLLRNRANEAALGDVRVVLDDDDYYPPERVRHAVESLAASKKQIAGCSPMLLFDYPSDRLFQFKSFGKNHSVASCMAWTSAYRGVCDPTARFAEESSFTNGFQAPMVQLDPQKTIVQSSHGQNTFCKKGLIETGLGKMLLQLETNPMPVSYLERFKNTFSPPK